MLFNNIIAFLKVKSYRTLTISTLSVLGTGTVFYHFVEGWHWFDSFYFSVITLSTVGYGDFSPHTVLGKAFTIVYILTGIGILFGLVNAFYEHRVKQHRDKQEKKEHAKKH
ncbi:potassium channel family protein [Mangrovibacterium diazotrophicum]|uniref:Ion channel n=1 Tax=Mangrovibacterium diazotrophicum TaxID=1261403 RepID=A0A419VV31_9BACT|nr:potassium channel family protein [Mangrovibacterium diazotrophicum]RKD86009.1 ion channel [Mangrovibacterium diazotrophicum]